MPSRRFGSVLYIGFLASLMLSPRPSFSQVVQGSIEFANSVPRISGTIDESHLTRLKGNTIPFATSVNDRGAVPAEQPMHRMLMLLRRSQEQEDALNGLMDAQQDPTSSAFHRWITPEQFGAEFGPSHEDVQTIRDWLTIHGFTKISLNKGSTVIEFSGTAGQVRAAFHTEIHRYQINGNIHLANDRDPSIPTALASVVAGVVSLNDFGRRSMAIRGPTLRPTKDQLRPKISSVVPDYTLPGSNGNSSFFGVGPYDFASIYDLMPLWNAGLDGTGQTIAIVGETDINVSDATNFRKFMGLPANDPTVLIAGADPGVQPDEIESDLDVEWSGAVARGAHIELVSAASTETTPGVDLAALYIVDNNLAPVMSESYGKCELFLGTTTNAFEKAMWQQAAAEGITVLVSSGDEGSTECDPTSLTQNIAVHPMAVSGLASTPYNVAVGGTDFNQYNKWAQYWSNTSDPTTKKSVLGYIPEIPWNDSCGSSILDAEVFGEDPAQACDQFAGPTNENTIATSGGPSSCVTSNSTDPSSCTGGWPKPVWQTGTGVPADGVRDIPDVSFFASNGVYNSAYVVCDADATPGASCDPNAASQAFVAVGGTSASAPAMAGVMAIINQKYGRQGNANFTLYRLASSSEGSSIFHDITVDGNRVACNSRSPDCQIPPGNIGPLGRTSGHDSTVGYDMVTGLGSIDIANLVNNWSAVSFTPTKTTLDLNGGTGTVTAVHGSAIAAIANVTASSGSPTGDVSLLGATENGSIYLGPIQSGSVRGTVNSLPGGSYAVKAHYAGDTQFAPSDSTAVNVNISAEPSSTKLSILNLDTTANAFAPAGTSVPYGSLLLLRADVKGQSGFGNATGSISLINGTSSLGQFGLNSKGYTEDIPDNLILAGTHALSASYPGDASFKASSGSGSITVTTAPMACTLGTNTWYLRPGWVVVATPDAGLYQAKLAPPLGTMVAPTGTMSIYSGSTLVAGPTLVTGIGSAIFPKLNAFQLPNATIPPVTLQFSQLASPTAPITIRYSGDANYASCTSSPLVLPYQTGPVTTQLAITPSTSYQNLPAGTPLTLAASIMAQNGVPPYEPAIPTPTGTIQLALDGVTVGSPVALMAGPDFGGILSGVASAVLTTTGLAAGTHSLVLSYSGDSNYLPVNSGVITLTVVVSDFSLALNPTNLTVASGQSTSPTTVQISYANGFSGATTFSCSGLPADAACIFTPSSLTNSGSTALSITTVKAQVIRAERSGQLEWRVGASFVSMGILVLWFVPGRRRRNGLLVVAGSVSLFLGMSSCGGGGGSGGSGTPNPTQYSTTTSLTATTATPSKGSTDTFTATVSPSGSSASLSGTVQFSVDSAASGSPVALSKGSAQFQTSFSTAGSHTVSAAYSGDSTNVASKSGPLSISVPYTSGSTPGNYVVTVTATSGSITHTARLNLIVQ